MEQRMTICNMSIEAGARAGLIAPDEKTFDYLRGREYTPANYEELVSYWRENLVSDPNATFEKSFTLNIDDIAPQVSWGTNPGMTCDVPDLVPADKISGFIPRHILHPDSRHSKFASMKILSSPISSACFFTI